MSKPEYQEQTGTAGNGALSCFLLTRQWRDTPEGLEFSFWARSTDGPVRILVRGERAVCFVEHRAHVDSSLEPGVSYDRKPLDLRTMHGKPVDGLYFRFQRDLLAARRALKSEGVSLFESDLKPSDRFLMERFITAAVELMGDPEMREGYLQFVNPAIRAARFTPVLKIVSIDIETEGLDGRLFSIAASGFGTPRAFIVSNRPLRSSDVEVTCCSDERGVLDAFFSWLTRADPDIVIGWNVVNFDLDFLERKCRDLGVDFAMGRGGERATILPAGGPGGARVARLPGRVVLDGIDALRAAFWSFDSFELETVSQALLGRGKRIHSEEDRVAEIVRLYRQDPMKLVEYNVEDCILVEEIFAKADLVNFAVRRSELTGLAMDRLSGSVAAFDHLYLPRLHRKGRVAIDVEDVESGEGSPGGYVMDSAPGIYDNVLLLDFKSLYPSIIRTFGVDPYALIEPGDDPIPGFLDAAFAREGAILPELIEELWRARDEAKRRRDAPLSQAVKILMNSFYGVLGTRACRFHDPRLASSITRRGHQIIRESRELIEKDGHRVIYGDTDSLFVLLGEGVTEGEAKERGARLALELSAWWRHRIREEFRLESFLELEFETHFLKFLMPTIRGADTGSKKRYAGLVRTHDGKKQIVFKGLESVRTDWTPLARRFQRELYRRVFMNEPYEDFVKQTLDALMAGKLDEELVYRKRLRRSLSEYTKNVPPHVQAARQLDNPGRWVRYVITRSGPQPVTGVIPKPDYAHYRDRQLAAAADGVLHFLGTSFDAITGKQLAMFD
ncbi:MAG TPA: DNA polymerase II [Gammaproteobacteria bacterium]|nr:DNA polymerase II [Gammaproteobacteria bacterium]